MSSTCLNKGKPMAEFPALPLFTDAYLGDTSHLTTIEHGAYMLLLISMWRSNGKLPEDDKLLARYTKLTSAQWKKIKPMIWPFFTVENGMIFQGRLTDELDFVRQKSKSQSKKAKARWLKTKDSPDATASSGHSHGNAPTPTPTPIKRDTKVSTKKATRLLDDWYLPNSWGEWAIKEGYNVDDVYLEAEKFKDYWIGVGGQKGTKLNWEATWRNWIRNSKQMNGGHNVNGNSNDATLESIARAARAR